MQTIRGKLKLHNGNTIAWEQFIDTDNREEAEKTAMQIVAAQHKEPIENCSIDRPFKYRATYLMADTEEDIYSEGCQPGTGVCKLSQKVNREADTLNGLIEKLAQEWGFNENPREGWIMMRDDDRDTVRIIYQHHENADGMTMTDTEREQWKKGEIKMWLADYSFTVEKVPAETLRIEDDEAASIGLEVS